LEGSSVQMSILDLLQHIVNEEPPKLPKGKGFPKEMEDFVDLCLNKDPRERPSPKDLLKNKYVLEAENAKVDLQGWVRTLN
jgi:mitogen-activated protein kinase kinase